MPDTRSVLVSGASRGFGFLTAATLARAGHRVFAGMREPSARNASARAELLERAAAGPGSIEVLELDVTSEDSVARAVGSIADANVELDVVVNNAGVAAAGVLESFTTEQVRELFEVNLLGVHRVNRAVLPRMLARGTGCLIHVSSTIGRYSIPFFGAYAASKFALEALSDVFRYELAPLGIESIVVQPGTFPTGMLGRMQGPADPSRVTAYGAQVALMEAMGAGLAAAMSAPEAPDPQEVADAIAGLVAMAPGTRPTRTLVDRQVRPVIEQVNRAMDDAQTRILTDMGIPHLLTTRTTLG